MVAERRTITINDVKEVVDVLVCSKCNREIVHCKDGMWRILCEPQGCWKFCKDGFHTIRPYIKRP